MTDEKKDPALPSLGDQSTPSDEAILTKGDPTIRDVVLNGGDDIEVDPFENIEDVKKPFPWKLAPLLILVLGVLFFLEWPNEKSISDTTETQIKIAPLKNPVVEEFEEPKTFVIDEKPFSEQELSSLNEKIEESSQHQREIKAIRDGFEKLIAERDQSIENNLKTIKANKSEMVELNVEIERLTILLDKKTSREKELIEKLRTFGEKVAASNGNKNKRKGIIVIPRKDTFQGVYGVNK